MEESPEDRIQRSLNESKKRELEEKYGPFQSSESKAPPEIESQFLRNIEEYEQQYQNAGQVTVGQFIGNPVFRKLGEIPHDELETELDTVLECLAGHNVLIDFLCDVPIEERYRFITEELMARETDDIRIEGMNHHFIYEEFHPNDQYDANMFAQDFLHFLLDGNVKYAMNAFSKDEIRDVAGAHTVASVMEKGIREFTGRFMTFIEKTVEPVECTVDGDYATTSFDVSWDGLTADTLERKTFTGIARVRMKRNPFEGWDVVQAIVPGWNA